MMTPEENAAAIRAIVNRVMLRYMKARGIGESAVDLIPDSIRRPCGPIRTNEGMYWTHTPGNLKLCTTFVRIAWSKP